MAQNAGDTRKPNQPSHEAQVKGGQHSQGNQQDSERDQSATHNQPSHDAQVKGGQHSQKSHDSKSSSGGSQQQPSHDAQVKGGQHSHSGGSNS